MGAKKKYKDPEAVGVEMLKAQVLMTETGFPAHLSLVEDCYGKAFPAPDPGWFWIGATPKSAEAIRRRGLHAVGTLTTTIIPVQKPPPPIEPFDRSMIPVIGSPAFIELMLAEKKEAAA